MKKKKYFHFALPRIIACLLVGAFIFEFTITIFINTYDSSLETGFDERGEMYEKLVRGYANGRYDDTLIDILTVFYSADYYRFAEIKEDGSFETITETNYDVVPVEDNLHLWYFVTNDEDLLEKEKKTLRLNDADWTIEYKKCDEAWDLSNYINGEITNSWDLCVMSGDLYYANKFFSIATELTGYLQYKQPTARSYYIDGDTLHLGKVTLSDLYSDAEGPFKTIWDFTDPAKADLYESIDEEGFAKQLFVCKRPVRPDKFLDAAGNLFLADNLDDLRSAAENFSNEGYGSYGNLTADDFNGKEDYYFHIYSIYDSSKTRGRFIICNIDGKQYLMEFVMVTAPFMTCYKPFLIIYAAVLFVLFLAIALIISIRPYTQYKKAYENNNFKNNLIDSLAHNMKTPLQILGGYAENLKDVNSDAEKDRYADQILAKTAEMNKDIEAILKTAEKSDMKLTKTSVRSCIEEAAKKKGADLNITGDNEIKMDKDYFCQALYCLIDNADKYKSEGSQVDVKIDKKSIVIRNKTDAAKFTSGTGLAIAGRILEQHRLKLNTKLEDGVFEAIISRK